MEVYCWENDPFLVGGFNHLEKYESQWEGLSHILWKNKTCSKPPTRFMIYGGFSIHRQ
jgi:hypothetical protein